MGDPVTITITNIPHDVLDFSKITTSVSALLRGTELVEGKGEDPDYGPDTSYSYTDETGKLNVVRVFGDDVEVIGRRASFSALAESYIGTALASGIFQGLLVTTPSFDSLPGVTLTSTADISAMAGDAA